MSRFHFLAVDPGLKPGVVEFEVADPHDDPSQVARVKRISHRLSDEWIYSIPKWDLVATEGQWHHEPKPGAPRGPRVNDLLKLAFRAGFALASIPAHRYMRIPPADWRGSTNADKAQIQRRIAETLGPAERALFGAIPKGRHGDVLDAIGIGRRAIEAALAGDCSFDWTR